MAVFSVLPGDIPADRERQMAMTAASTRFCISLAVLLLWGATTMFGAQLLAGGEEISLNDLVQQGIGWQFVGAIVILLAVIFAFRWKDIGFNKPHSLLHVLWFPSIYLFVFAGLIVLLGLPPLMSTMLVFVNTMLVGFSEEVMFRGVLFRASLKQMAVWPAIILNMILFGGVHAFNGFITGEFGAAIVQSFAAGMSGLLFIAILLRTGSIWPAIVYHGLWDFAIFTLGMSSSRAGDAAAVGDVSPHSVFLPLLLNLPNFLFALVLLRNIHKKPL
jgi:hypothetical protein